MAFSDLCKISNAYKTVENEADQSERIMEENSMVRDLITKILDDAGPADVQSTSKPPDKMLSTIHPTTQYANTSTNTTFVTSPSFNNFQEPLYNFPQSEQNGFNFNLQNGYVNTNGFVNYESDVNSLLGFDSIGETNDVTPEQLNLLRLAAQEIGGAQFTNPSPKFDDKYYNFFEPSQRSSLQEPNMFPANYNRPNSLNMDTMNFNSNLMESNPYNMQRYPNKYADNYSKDAQNTQESNELLQYLNNLNISLEGQRDDIMHNGITEFKPQMAANCLQNEEFNKLSDNKMFFNRNFPNNKFNSDYYANADMMKNEKYARNFEFQNHGNFKPNEFQHQNDFMQRRDMNQGMSRENFQGNSMNEQRNNFDNPIVREQQAALMRQNQELARQMSLIMRNRPPNQLNVDVSFLHDNAPFNLGLGALLGPNPQVPPQVLPSPLLDMPLLAPFYAMRNMRTTQTSSAILHARLDACYEQWRQLERERKRTEARLALSYPGRAVSSSNSLPVPRLPPCPTRVDRLTVDMLREHTKVLTLMGKMETLRASVCVAQNKKPQSPDTKITVLKRGQENVSSEKPGADPENFQPSTWREDVTNLSDIAPHSEIESAMLSWRNAVCAVQTARRRELAPHTDRFRTDPIIQLAEAVKQLSVCARRARCAMWCDLTLTVALAPNNNPENIRINIDKQPLSSQLPSPKQNIQETNNNTNQNNANAFKPATEVKEEKSQNEKMKTEKQENKTANKPENKDKNQNRRTQNYNRHKLNHGRSDFYQKNQRYDTRFMPNRHPYYLATGPIN